MSKDVAFRQEMPPPGGFKDYEWQRRIAKPRMSGYRQLGLFFGYTAITTGVYCLTQAYILAQEQEMNDARLAIEPLIQAERNRMYLKLIRKNRDEENEVMKNYPGWQTGKLFDTPVYYNPRNRYIPLHMYEVHVTGDRKTLNRRCNPQIHVF